jgi:murein DD-endopeptidase MepM/ murein hydrolase activator NlpD
MQFGYSISTCQLGSVMKDHWFSLIFALLGLAACGPSLEQVASQTASVATQAAAAWTETPSATATTTDTPTLVPTTTPLPTETPTATVPPLLILQRPVPETVPLYHGYGEITNSIVGYTGFHPGYDYGTPQLGCTLIEEPIIAMAPGIVVETAVDKDHPSGKNGWIRIDYGVYFLADGRTAHVVSQFGHVIPLVQVGDVVDTNTHVADFSTCERYGYSPELEIQIFSLDPIATRDLQGQEILAYIGSHWEDGLTIDPVLAGLAPR